MTTFPYFFKALWEYRLTLNVWKLILGVSSGLLEIHIIVWCVNAILCSQKWCRIPFYFSHSNVAQNNLRCSICAIKMGPMPLPHGVNSFAPFHSFALGFCQRLIFSRYICCGPSGWFKHLSCVIIFLQKLMWNFKWISLKNGGLSIIFKM